MVLGTRHDWGSWEWRAAASLGAQIRSVDSGGGPASTCCCAVWPLACWLRALHVQPCVGSVSYTAAAQRLHVPGTREAGRLGQISSSTAHSAPATARRRGIRVRGSARECSVIPACVVALENQRGQRSIQLAQAMAQHAPSFPPAGPTHVHGPRGRIPPPPHPRACPNCPRSHVLCLECCLGCGLRLRDQLLSGEVWFGARCVCDTASAQSHMQYHRHRAQPMPQTMLHTLVKHAHTCGTLLNSLPDSSQIQASSSSNGFSSSCT